MLPRLASPLDCLVALAHVRATRATACHCRGCFDLCNDFADSSIWAIACTFQGAYLVSMRSSIPLQIQPQLFGFFGCISWAQCLYYGSKIPLRKVLLYLGVLYAILGGFEVGSVYALWAGERNGVNWPKQMYGWITSALLVAGLMPEYWEIYKHKAVVGISVMFMVVDILGGIFSGVSLFFREELDYTALAQYMLVVVFDGIVVLLVPILNPRAKRRAACEAALRQEEAAVGGDVEPIEGEVAIDERTHTLIGTHAHEHHHLHNGELERASVTYSSNLTAVGQDDKSLKDTASRSSDDTDSALKR